MGALLVNVVFAQPALVVCRTLLLSLLYVSASLAQQPPIPPGATPGGLMASLPTWHMAFLMATGTGVALLTLARDEPAGGLTVRSDPAAVLHYGAWPAPAGRPRLAC